MTRQKSGTLAFRNPDQKVLFDCELSGQLSDGQWENTEPQDHWVAWCTADTIVAEDPEDVGRDFDVKKQGYGFTRKEFLGDPNDPGFSIAERMMGYVRVARTFGYDVNVREVADYDKPRDHQDDATSALIESIDQTRKAAVMADASIYDRKQLIADLRDISAIMKIDLRVGLDGFYKTDGRFGRDDIHVGRCPKIGRQAEWRRREVTRSAAIEGLARTYYGDRLDDCVPTEVRQALGAEVNAIRQAAAIEERRRNLLIDAAVAYVASEKLAESVGPTTQAETLLFDTYVKQIRSGEFTPHSVRDLREVAIKQSSV